MKKRINFKVLVISLFIVYSIAFIGSLFTDTGEWYQEIKPSITPPNYVFPIVWNILFFLIAISLYLVWISSKKKEKKKIIYVYGINFLLNILWSVLFFGMKNPLFAFYELILLEISIGMMIYTNYKTNKTSSYLLIPYFLWVGFAGILNFLMI